ncbi:SCO3242 family prenyltransferase [Streptomyces sp. NPDC059009]|uniref:SCO3242 family prenyltransferase n=1 Tax=Streptomyces sp. NPDC059009 TaxID=3346694 RepID=UPI00368EE9CA
MSARASGGGGGLGGGGGRGHGRARAWAELLRLPALFTVPGDALVGAAATGLRPNRRTLLALTSSLCLYEAGMALNDWADRAEDAVDRPERPIPSGRIAPTAALAAATALTGAGLAVASRAGRPALAVATTLAATVWAYDLGLKRTWAGPVAMGAARGLDVVLGAVGTGSPALPVRRALPAAAAMAGHTLAVTAVSRRETQGGSAAPPLAALATTAALAQLIGRGSTPERPSGTPGHTTTLGTRPALREALAAGYAATAARPLFHAALNPSPPLTQRAVGGGIRALIPLQAALCARAGAPRTALFAAALAPAARKFAKKVSVT